MTLTYSLDQNDFLQNQLYIASSSKTLKKKRKSAWLGSTSALFLLSIIFLYFGNTLFFFYFLLVSILALILLPTYQRKKLKKHYSNYITENYQYRIGKIVNIHFTESDIHTQDITGETTIRLSEIENITETTDYFYIRMKTKHVLIISKLKVYNPYDVKVELQRISQKLNVDFVEDLNWKWK